MVLAGGPADLRLHAERLLVSGPRVHRADVGARHEGSPGRVVDASPDIERAPTTLVLHQTHARGMTKRELVDTGRDKRYVRRDEQGRFHESDDVGKSLSQDRRRDAKHSAPEGMKDKGD